MIADFEQLSSLTSCLWIWTGERNLLAMRKCVYAAVTKKDLVWFDTKTEDSNDLGAGGLMAKFAKYVFLISIEAE